MKKCLNCGKEVIQTPGKKEKKYCDAKCKQQHWHKLRAAKKDTVKISREEYELLLKGNVKEITDFKIEEVSITKDGNAAIGISNIKFKKPSKPIVKELNKEGSKPYKPKQQDQNLSYLKKRQERKLK